MNQALSNHALFFSGIHMDLLGALAAPAKMGSSNPGAFSSMPGGASLNTASVAACLGLDSSIIGLIGDDQHENTLRTTLAQRGIKDLLCTKPGQSTGCYTSIIEPDGNLVIAVADLGLNESITSQWLLETHEQAMQNADIWFLNSNLTHDALTQLTQPDLSIRPKILAAASISPSKAKNLAPSLPNLDVLFTNIAEANALLDSHGGLPAGQHTRNASDCMQQFQQLGILKGSLSQGAEVLWVWDQNDCFSFKPAILNQVKDVTGAGDALAGTFLAGLAQYKSMREIAPLAIAAAQMTLDVMGPYNENINMQELKSRAVHVTQIS